jgi:hypothetical protein
MIIVACGYELQDHQEAICISESSTGASWLHAKLIYSMLLALCSLLLALCSLLLAPCPLPYAHCRFPIWKERYPLINTGELFSMIMIGTLWKKPSIMIPISNALTYLSKAPTLKCAPSLA